MAELLELWLPILLSAVGVFVVSSVIHMCTPLHKGDHGKLAGEGKVLESMRAEGVTPGMYMFPCASSMKDMGTPEMIEKYEQGPVGYVTVLPTGTPAIGKSLLQWFLFSVVVSIFVGYVCSFSLGKDIEYMAVFRLASTVAFMGYSMATICDSIWKGAAWKVTCKFMFDGLLYALTTAGIFASLWPSA